MILPPAITQNALANQPVGNFDTWQSPPAPPHNTPVGGIAPPGLCPQPCPVAVDINFCRPRPWPRVTMDRWGDPQTLVPPGVRTEPYWTPSAIKASPGGPVLVGPDHTLIYPAPELPEAARGAVVAAGGSLGPMGEPVYGADELLAPTALTALQRVPWWGWVLGAVVAAKLLGGRR